MEERIWFQSGPYKIEGLWHRGNPDTGVVITHPHPLYGGDMDNYVVKTIAEVYRKKGYTTLRFNFRGVGASEGKYEEGIGEQEDVIAAVGCLLQNGIKQADLAGYSFGAWVNAHIACETAGIRHMLMVSPPVDFLSFDAISALPCFTHAICGDKDEFAAVENVRAMISRCNPDAVLEVLPNCNHFYSIALNGLENFLQTHLEQCEKSAPVSQKGSKNITDLKRFFRACNPTRSLDISKEEDRKYYVDFSAVRSGNLLREIKRSIVLSDTPAIQLFTGHTGCGKSTELLRLKNELEKENYRVLCFDAAAETDTDGTDAGGLLFRIARKAAENLREEGMELPTGIFRQDASASAGESICDSIREDLFAPAERQLKEQGKKGLLLIVDNPDYMGSLSENREPEYIFIELGEQLKRLQIHTVLTIPLSLLFSGASEKLKQCFGVSPKILPLISLQDRNGNLNEEGMKRMKEMVLARAFPDTEKTERESRLSFLFAAPEMAEQICRMSGGHVRNLIHMLYSCLQKDDPPFSKKILEEVLQEERDVLMRKMQQHEKDLLHKVAENQSAGGEKEYESLLRNMFVFEYEDKEGLWYGVNPLLHV